MMRRSSVVGVFILGLGLAATAAAEKDRYEVGEEVKSFTLKVVNADTVGESYVGVDRYYGPDAKEPKKAILLSFFATYCEPCKREMPYLAALYDHYKDKGLVILSISIDKEPDQIEFVKELATKSGAKFPVLSDRFNIVAKRYFISKLPCVYLVGSDGKVSMVNVGYNDDISRSLLDNIRKAVGEPSTDPIPEQLAAHLKGHGGAPEAVDVPGEEATAASDTPGQANTEEAAAVGDDAKGKVEAAVDNGDNGKSKGKKARAKKVKVKRKGKRVR